MAFNESKLKTDIQKVFRDMQSDDDFCEGLASLCQEFGESGDIVTTDTGTVSSGVFSGSGSGGLTLSDSLMSEPLKTACIEMKKGEMQNGDDYLAEEIGKAIKAMTDSGEVNTDVTGVTTSPQGQTVPPSSGKAKGTITCSNADLIQGLKDCFASMKSRYAEESFDGDEYFASELASLVHSYFTAGVIATSGQGELNGTTGTGSIS